MKKNIILFLIGFCQLIGLLVICQSGNSQSYNTNIIRLNSDFEKTGSLKMSDLFSEITYIPLETNPSCLIGYMNIPVFDKDIIISSNGGRNIFRFSEDGKFLNRIGNEGRGPEEYLDNCDVLLIGDTVFVVSNFSNDIVCYSLTGAFLKKYHINIKARPKSIVQLPDKSFMISLSNLSDLGIIIKTGKDFSIEGGFIKNVPLYDNPLVNSFERSGNKIFYYYNYIDTIFEISRGYPIPSIVIDYGKYRTSKEKVSIYEKDNIILNRPRILDFSASDEYFQLSIYYPFLKSTYTILYRISDGKQLTWSKLINDIDKGTLDRWPGFLAGNKLIFHLMPSTVLERFGKMTDSEKSDPKNSGFVEMASNLKPESNPVLMICKLK